MEMHVLCTVSRLVSYFYALFIYLFIYLNIIYLNIIKHISVCFFGKCHILSFGKCGIRPISIRVSLSVLVLSLL